MNKNHITRLLILLIALHISSCANTSSRQPSPELEKIDIAQELKTQTKAELLKKLYRPENSKYSRYISSEFHRAIIELYPKQKNTHINTLLADLDKAGIPYTKTKANGKYINIALTKQAAAQGSKENIYYKKAYTYTIEQEVYPIKGAYIRDSISHYLLKMHISTAVDTQEIIQSESTDYPQRKISYYSDKLTALLEAQDRDALLDYLKATYPHNTDANDLIQDLKATGASLEERKIDTGEYRFFVLRYTSKNLTWWQSTRGVAAIVTKILLKTSHNNKIISWDKYVTYPKGPATFSSWHLVKNSANRDNKFINECCHFIHIIPIYTPLDIYDYYIPNTFKEALLYYYPLGTKIDLITEAMQKFGFKITFHHPKRADAKYRELEMNLRKNGYWQDFFIDTEWNIVLFHNPNENILTYLGVHAGGHWPHLHTTLY